jgi:hypothetical protein
MRYFTGTNTVKAHPMTLNAYQDYRELPNTNPNKSGYLVELIGDIAKNHPNHQYRIAWLDTSIFESIYHNHEKLTFSEALYLMERGAKLTRTSWKDTNIFIIKHEPNEYLDKPCLIITINKETTPWFGTNEDYFAKDWLVIQE